MRLIGVLLALCLLLPVGLATAQSGIQLTPEQQRMLNQLPAGQRAEVLRQMRQATDAVAPPDLPLDTPVDADEEEGELGDAEELEPSAGTIRPDDVLIVEIEFPEEDPADRFTATVRQTEEHLLLGRHTVRIDAFGRLSMPGIAEVPLAGLNAKQAELRLRAEPILKDMAVTVTRLPLTPVGREALEPFGYETFRRASTTRDQLNAAVPADYVVGPGDTISLHLFGKEPRSEQLEVTRDGLLHLPNLGPVPVSGQTFADLRAMIERRYREGTIGTQASVSMGQLRSIEVFVIGEVERPGAQLVSSMATVLNALYAAGGISEIGSLRGVQVVRDGERATRLDLYELLLRGDAGDDIRLNPGDVVFVPATGPRAGAIGEVLRPAWYELAGTTTVGELLDFAGGGSTRANLRQVQVERKGADGRMRYINVDATTAAGRDLEILASDLVRVPRVSEVASHALFLRGHFSLPGRHAWREDMQLSDILTDATALLPNPDLDYALVVRQLPDGTGVGVEMFSPRAIFEQPDSGQDLVLLPRDEVYVFGLDRTVERRALMDDLVERLRDQATRGAGAQVAQVAGAVHAPGYYPLARGMVLSDLVRAGGGLLESAYEGTAEVTRYDSATGVRQIDHLELDITQVLEGEAGANLLVQPHDVLTVKQTPQWADQRTVELRGEVRFPGVYPLSPGEMISNVIERAGGLTEFAYPRAAVFTRETLREREQEQIDNMIQRLEADIATAATRQASTDAQQSQAVAQSMVQQLRNTPAVGRLVIDLPRLIENPGSRHFDVLAHDGDVLIVPPRPQEVTVLGEVYFPTSHIYDPELERNDYIGSSGGMTNRADKGRIYIVRASGAVEASRRSIFGSTSGDIQPGDTIVVPIDAERLPLMVRLMNISQIMSQIAITAAALQTIGAI